MDELPKQVGRLTVAELAEQARSAVATLPLSISRNRDVISYFLSVYVLRFFLGDVWTNAHVLGYSSHPSTELSLNRRFLRVTDGSGRLSDTLHLTRVSSLSQMLFRLQGTEGIDERIDHLNSGTLESALAEFECLSFLAGSELDFKFVRRTQRRGCDYEAEITTRSGRTICCEVKAKFESTSPSARALADSISKARKQLPRDKPCIVMIRTSGAWIGAVGELEVRRTIEASLRNSNRLVAICLVWEREIKRFQVTDVEWQIGMATFRNRSSAYYDEDVEEALNRVTAHRGFDKTYLHVIAAHAVYHAITNAIGTQTLDANTIPALKAVTIVGMMVDRGKDIPNNENIETSIEYRCERFDEAESHKLLYIYHTLTLSNHNSNPGAKVFMLTAAFQSTYELPVSVDPEKFDGYAFAMSTGLLYVWPYWRELAQSTMMKMGLEPLSINLLTADQLPLPIGRPVPDAT